MYLTHIWQIPAKTPFVSLIIIWSRAVYDYNVPHNGPEVPHDDNLESYQGMQWDTNGTDSTPPHVMQEMPGIL
jgi:hypothetical protein